MKQVVQSLSGGPVRVLDVPRPVIGPTQVLVHTSASLVSAGTERAVAALARSSLVHKARARPDLVRQVFEKARRDGMRHTVAAVRTRLGGDMPLGYSAAGVVVDVGDAVADIRIGQVVATGGAPHAELQAVPGLLCCPAPQGMAAEHAAFATVGSIALHALHLAELQPGSNVAVVGLGLVGQLAARLALAAGHRVVGIDVAAFPIERARSAGVHALADDGEQTTKAAWDVTRGLGADAVLVTAADESSAILRRAPALCRDRATIVVVGDVGMELSRRALYEKELTVRVARSYGPGRYERTYEEWGVDYPPGQIRWTEGRNQRAVIELLASGRLVVGDLVTHRFPIADASAAYQLVDRRAQPYLGVILTYADGAVPDEPIRLAPRPSAAGEPAIGLVGAGAFASGVLLPAFRQAGFTRLRSVASASGISARTLGERAGFEQVVAGGSAVAADPEVAIVVIATAHDTHARLATEALRAGKSVWCEKPLALSAEELDEVEHAYRENGGILFVGFNRRFSPAIARVRDHLRGAGPVVITYRVNAGLLARDHWYGDRRQGGRLLGEICHFVDTCMALAGDVVDVQAYASNKHELLLADDFVLALRHADGSLSSISYAAGGHPSTEKERLEVLGRGHSATVVDYREIVLDGRAERLGGQDKGHLAAVRAFRHAVLCGDQGAFSGLEASRVVLRAAGSLR